MADNKSTPCSYQFGSFKADNDPNMSLTISVYMGSLVLCVFMKGPPCRFTVPRSAVSMLKKTITNTINGQPGQKTSFDFIKWDPETKKQEPIGNLVVGKDDKGMIYFGVTAPSMPPTKFTIKAPLGIDTSEPMSDVDRSLLGAETLIEQLAHDIPMAILMTTQKKEPNSSGYKKAPYGQPYGRPAPSTPW